MKSYIRQFTKTFSMEIRGYLFYKCKTLLSFNKKKCKEHLNDKKNGDDIKMYYSNKKYMNTICGKYIMSRNFCYILVK